MISSSGTKRVPESPTATNRGSISLGTFTRAKVEACVSGSSTRTASDSDRFEMYGNGPPEPDRQRREDGEDLAVELLGQLRALVVGDLVVAEDLDAVLGQLGPQLALHAARLALARAR